LSFLNQDSEPGTTGSTYNFAKIKEILSDAKFKDRIECEIMKTRRDKSNDEIVQIYDRKRLQITLMVCYEKFERSQTDNEKLRRIVRDGFIYEEDMQDLCRLLKRDGYHDLIEIISNTKITPEDIEAAPLG
jgi:hypothetical protein